MISQETAERTEYAHKMIHGTPVAIYIGDELAFRCKLENTKLDFEYKPCFGEENALNLFGMIYSNFAPNEDLKNEIAALFSQTKETPTVYERHKESEKLPSTWISADDRLPEQDEPAIAAVIDKKGRPYTRICFYSDLCGWTSAFDGSWNVYNVYAWMPYPLPPDPKEMNR